MQCASHMMIYSGKGSLKALSTKNQMYTTGKLLSMPQVLMHSMNPKGSKMTSLSLKMIFGNIKTNQITYNDKNSS